MEVTTIQPGEQHGEASNHERRWSILDFYSFPSASTNRIDTGRRTASCTTVAAANPVRPPLSRRRPRRRRGDQRQPCRGGGDRTAEETGAYHGSRLATASVPRRAAVPRRPGACLLRRPRGSGDHVNCWHPFLQTWVISATHRQDRPHKPPPEYCPLCPTSPALFRPKYPQMIRNRRVRKQISVAAHRPPPTRIAGPTYIRGAGGGRLRSRLVFREPLRHVRRWNRHPPAQLGEVWADRFEELGNMPGIDYVMILKTGGTRWGSRCTIPTANLCVSVCAAHSGARIGRRPTTFRPVWALSRLRRHRGRAERRSPHHLRRRAFRGRCPVFCPLPYEVHVPPPRPSPALVDLGARTLVVGPRVESGVDEVR